ncbi:DUF3426 domain-containing protein [Stutzerimonas azotifigens]|uniref:DUF3426 domain-containing protein n=1 Tax=Stutzerimonas azotifigens TaxID=291995 RepID=UPI00040C9321|nr:DUF3426 domain-containing protein [Stutzerimonas azotifigens]
MTSFVTQCPHCRTSFRVNPAQLSAAKGMVRCGTCLEVFNAGRHLQADQGMPQMPAAQPANPQAQPPLVARRLDEDELLIHDDMDLDDIDLDEELARLERQEREAFAARRGAGEPPQAAPPAPISENAEPPLRAEPRPARMPEAAPPKAAVRLTPVSEEAPLPPSPLSVSERPLRAAADDLEDDEPLAPARSQRREPGLHDAPLFELEEEPLQLDWQPTRKPWGRRLGWTLLCLLALLALAGQYAAYNFEELARRDEYRPWFERLCPTLGCTLPSKVDISQIRSSNLMVRSHPDFTGALVVDAILYNRAPFSQPFPLLELRFADLGGKLIASRQFKPGEYLAGELAGEAEMPPQTPIHIALEILDPGDQAVNYSLSFHSPE